MFNFTLIRSPRRKRSVALSVQRDGTLRVVAPLSTSLEWIKSFIARKEKWVAGRRAAFAARTAKNKALKDGDEIPFMGNRLRLALTDGAQGVEGDKLRLFASAGEDAELALRLWHKKQARQLLPARTQEWAEKTGLYPTRVSISSPAKRWGSCSPKNEIRLNWRLVTLAPEIIDYVIVHELAHIKHKNHGPSFWRCVEKIMPDCKKRRKLLRSKEREND